MTALKEYDRLEAVALWRLTTQDQRREVIVSLGDATLTISDTKGMALAHWSIAATQRSNGSALPAIYHPDGDPEETLEFPGDEKTMIDAIDKLLRSVERRRPKPGKLRLVLSVTTAALLVAAALLWLPGALDRYAVKVLPPVKRVEIGRTLLTHLTQLTGQPCATADGLASLSRLGRRVLGPESSRALTVVPEGVRDTVSLPGGLMLLNRAIVEDHEDPDVAAGYVLAEYVRSQADDPLAEFLDFAGMRASLRLLTTGNLPKSVYAPYAEHVLTHSRKEPDSAQLLEAFASRELRSTPYAYARDITGESTLLLIEADPMRAAGSRQVLTDNQWLRLQSICEE